MTARAPRPLEGRWLLVPRMGYYELCELADRLVWAAAALTVAWCAAVVWGCLS